MKKTYIAPSMEMLVSDTIGQLLTASLPTDGSTTITTDEILSRRHQIDWDDEEDEDIY